MAESTVIVINEESTVGRALNCMDSTKHLSKRKRAAALPEEPENSEKRDAFLEGLSSEIETLFSFFNEVSDGDFALAVWRRGEHGFDINSSIACLIEESSKPLSKLVDDIYNILNDKGMNVGVTMTFLRSSVLKIGLRSSYGLTDPDADLLEDENQSNLWCWETRDLKLMPKSIRMDLKIRRTCRKKIHERITAVYGVLTTLKNFNGDQNVIFYLTKAEEKLSKVLNETDIRSLKADMNEKRLQEEERVLLNQLEKNKREAQKEEIKQMEKNKREAQKEEIKLQREIQREKSEKERQLKRLQEEENKEKKRKEREEREMKKVLRRQQEEAEREQRHREKEGDDIKKQMAIQKQASIMDRFLKRSKNISTCNIEPSLRNVEFNKFILNEKEMGESASQAMDLILLQKDGHNIDEIIREHMSEWNRLGSSHSCRNRHWGRRQKPKSHLFNNIKLTTTQQVDNDELEVCEVHDDTDEKCEISVDVNIIQLKKCNQKRQLLQFDKSHRPAFYGVWHKMSLVVGPRHPFRKDPELDYEIDSDDEWEEEDPGESLSDCERDGDEECEEGMSKVDDEDESEDGFFVPDGYLSETEGVGADEIECSPSELDMSENCNREQWMDGDELNSLYKQQKILHSFTENALRKNRPLIVLNLMHEKLGLTSNDPTDVSKVEQTCLQALKMIPFPNRAPIEPCFGEEDDEDCNTIVDSQASISNPISAVVKPDLPKIVSVIQSNPKGMGKVVENLHQEFPDMPKSQLMRKVREISNFVDNRWQVRKDILEKVGPLVTPEKGNGGTRSIASFFSKRCLPPADNKDDGAAL